MYRRFIVQFTISREFRGNLHFGGQQFAPKIQVLVLGSWFYISFYISLPTHFKDIDTGDDAKEFILMFLIVRLYLQVKWTNCGSHKVFPSQIDGDRIVTRKLLYQNKCQGSIMNDPKLNLVNTFRTREQECRESKHLFAFRQQKG